MRVLIIGGTAFVGRHIAEAAIAAGHAVTVFHRGLTGTELFPQATHLLGDRDEDLSALADGRWDATVDVCAYVPRQVRSIAEALDGRGGRYVFISSTSAYRIPVSPGFTEDAPLAELDDPSILTADQVTDATYGGLKVACERAAIEFFGDADGAAGGPVIVRPTYVIGPHDRSYRFTWWVERIARGGRVLAPGGPDDPIQVIDARDLASWIVRVIELSVTGIFHAVSPPPPFGFGALLEAIAAEVAPPGTRLTWVEPHFLTELGESVETIPLWPGGDSEREINTADPARAYAAGLTPRPIRQSVAEIHAAERAANQPPPAGVGLTAEREAELLAAWDAIRPAGPTKPKPDSPA
jgi:2'-hydroxyisoflavone reductase